MANVFQKVAQKYKSHNRTDKVAKVMREFKRGKLKSSSGERVIKHKQAVAIALSEQRRAQS